MRVLASVVDRLQELEMRSVLIGAAAMAVHGVTRSTVDVDLLTVERPALASESWWALEEEGIRVEIRHGDIDDPLAGVVRFTAADERAVDLVVGKKAWQRGVIERAETASYGEVPLRVARVADLVLLKLYAGGPQDAWDVTQLLAGDHSAELVAEVEEQVEALDADAQALWREIRQRG